MITIAIPTIGRIAEERFNEAIASAIDTDPRIVTQIVVLDNSQNADFGQMLTAWHDRDRRIQILASEQRLQMGENWNRALGHVSNKWLIYLHDDDILLGKALANAELFLGNQAGFIAFNHIVDVNGRRTTKRRRPGLDGTITDTPKFASTILNVGRLREVGAWDDRAGYFLDMLTFLKLELAFGSRHVDQALGIYRIHAENSSVVHDKHEVYGECIPYVVAELFRHTKDPAVRRHLLLFMAGYAYPRADLKCRVARRIARLLRTGVDCI